MCDFKIFWTNEEGTIRRQTFNFTSPAPLVSSDRDFYFLYMIRRDFPQQGDISVFQKSLPDHPEYPHQSGKVRAFMNMVAMVFRPVKDENGNESTDVFLVTSVNVGGWLPSALVNSVSASVPREQFTKHEEASKQYAERTKSQQ